MLNKLSFIYIIILLLAWLYSSKTLHIRPFECHLLGIQHGLWKTFGNLTHVWWEPYYLDSRLCSYSSMIEKIQHIFRNNFRILFVGDSHMRNLFDVFLDLVIEDNCTAPRYTQPNKPRNMANFYANSCGLRARGWTSCHAFLPTTARGFVNLTAEFKWAPRYRPFSKQANCSLTLPLPDQAYLASQIALNCTTAIEFIQQRAFDFDLIILNWPQYELMQKSYMRTALLELFNMITTKLLLFNHFPALTDEIKYFHDHAMPVLDLSNLSTPLLMYDSAHLQQPPLEVAISVLLFYIQTTIF